MNTKIQKAIEKYQCSGCVAGHGISCFKPNEISGGVGCGKHLAGTLIMGIGSIFLGLPKGFNRLGLSDKMKPIIFNNIKEFIESDWGEYNKFNVPVWKHLDNNGYTLVRGFMPRKN